MCNYAFILVAFKLVFILKTLINERTYIAIEASIQLIDNFIDHTTKKYNHIVSLQMTGN